MNERLVTDRKLLDFKVLSFDCYGTLIDWETGIWDALQPLLMQLESPLSRSDALRSFGEHEHRLESVSPDANYRTILHDVHHALATEFGASSSMELDEAFAHSVAHWPAFADTAEALRELQRHFHLVVLSNVDHASFAASAGKLGVTFDALYLAEDIGSYKPDDANFRYLLDRVQADLQCDKSELLHTAQSLMHDHQVANRHGISNAWIDRQRLSESGDWGATKALDTWPSFDFQFFSMRELADAVLAEDSM
ncbi:MAG: haloacid dehalogenase type II [Pseudomonadota bacterium]